MVDVFSEWAGPCNAMQNYLKKIKLEVKLLKKNDIRDVCSTNSFLTFWLFFADFVHFVHFAYFADFADFSDVADFADFTDFADFADIVGPFQCLGAH